MLDVVLAVTCVIAIVHSARQRFVFGIVCAVAVAYGLVASAFCVLTAVRRGAVGAEYAFGLLFLGPSAVPASGGSPLPTSTWIALHPLTSLLGSAVLGAAPWAWASRKSTRLSPHSVESRGWDAVSSSFLLLTVIALARLVLGGLVEIFMARSARP